MDVDRDQPHRSHLFSVRLWQEALDGEHTEWRGKVKHVLSGQTRYFRAWPDLVANIQAMLLDTELAQHDDNTTDS